VILSSGVGRVASPRRRGSAGGIPFRVPPVENKVTCDASVAVEGPGSGADAVVSEDAVDPRRRRRGLVCCGCGYDLRGLPIAAACPECATLVADSLGGRPIRPGERGWARAVGAGAIVSGAAVFVWPLGFLVVLVGVVVGLVGGETLGSILWWRWTWAVGSLVVCELALGWWCLTLPERRRDGGAVAGPEGGRAKRRRLFARVAGVSAAALTLAAFGMTLLGRAGVEAALRRVVGAPPGFLDGPGWAMLVLLTLAAGASSLLLAAHVVTLGEAARLAGRAGDWKLSDRLLALRRAPLLILAFWVGAILLTPVVAMIDLIVGLLVMIYLTAVNLLMPSLIVGSVMLSGASQVALGRLLTRAGRSGPSGRSARRRPTKRRTRRTPTPHPIASSS